MYRHHPPDQLRPLLDQIAFAYPADAIFVYELNIDSARLERVTIHARHVRLDAGSDVQPLSADAQYVLDLTVSDALDAAFALDAAAEGKKSRKTSAHQNLFIGVHPPYRLPSHLIERTLFADGMIFPLANDDQVFGALALFCHAELPSTRHLKAVMPFIALLQSQLEKRALTEIVEQSVWGAQAILALAQAMSESPTSQEVVEILRRTVLDSHISSCGLLLYAPLVEDHPNTPFEYLEIGGSWSKRVGSGVGTGLRLSLKDYPALIEQIEREQVVVISNLKDMRDRFDPLVRGLLRAERIRSLTFLSLHSARRKIGVLVIATDKRYEFPIRELNQYRTVSEFLAISSMAQRLQQQRDQVQQGRAALLDAVTDGVIMVTPQGGRGGGVLTVNDRFTALFALGEVRAEGIALNDLLDAMQIPEGVREELRRAWMRTPVRDPIRLHGEFSMMGHEGRPLDVEWYSAPVYQGGQVLGRIYIFHDVTAERAAARLRAAFLSRVSHELRTPLTSIKGFAEFILEAVGDQLPDLAREYTEIIHNSARHLNHVFNDIIEISRADAGELKMNKITASLADIVIDVVARLEMQFKDRHQTVIMDVDDDLPPISADVDRIIQVLTNLLTNAIKYSPEGGTIYAKTELVERFDQLGERLHGASAPPDVTLPAILVTVRDQGRGLSAEDAEQVFLPFYRTDDAKREKIEGVGLGLSVTRSLVEMHRGKIWAIPREAAGSGLFAFTLPIVRG